MNQLEQENNVLLQSPPGTGKTTRIPAALLNYFSGIILVLQPRRIAARVLAEFVAKSLNEKVGQTVGYHFRLEKKISQHTRLIFITEGMLLQYLAQDPFLKKVSVVVLDEFHERNIHSDVAVSSLRTLQKAALEKAQLMEAQTKGNTKIVKLLVMSATLETKGLDIFLGVSKIIKVEGQRYPLQRIFRTGDFEKELKAIVFGNKTKGDILVFLPGKREILNAKNILETSGDNHNSFSITSDQTELRELKICTLFGDMPVEEQKSSLIPDPNYKKVILSTNIAETSLTIEGVDCVIDSGLQRSARYSWVNGLTKLETKKISKASAIQRAGRSNRNGPGLCYHLFSEQDFSQMTDFELPEIHRGDLSQHILQLLHLGLFKDIFWFEAPRDNAIEKTFKFLEELGAVSEFEITAIGKKISKISLPPRLARVAAESARTPWERQIIQVLAKLSESSLEQGPLEFTKVSTKNARILRSNSTELRLEEQIVAQLNRFSLVPDKKIASVGNIFLSGFRDRVGQYIKVDKQDLEYRLSGGGTARLRREKVAEPPEFIIVLDAFEQTLGLNSFFRVTHFMNVDENDLWNHPALLTQSEIFWNSSKNSLEKSTAICFGQLKLACEKESFTDDELEMSGEIYLKEALSVKNFEFTSSSAAIEYLSHRMDIEELKKQLIRILKTVVELKITKMIEILNNPKIWLPLAFNGIISKKILENHDWARAILSECSSKEEYDITQHRDKYFPSFLTLNSGKRIIINYEFEKPPWLAARLQEFFGMTQIPQLGMHREALLIHLLAPNMRALHITGDLSSFWKNHYPMVRKELMRRYPRHKWPEDPLALTEI